MPRSRVMRWGSTTRLVSLLLGLALAVGVRAVRAEEPPPDRAAFEKGVERAKGLLGREICAQGLRLVRELLETHARKDYVRARRAELEDLVRRLAFGVEHPTPKPQSLVSGKLVRYVPTTGRIRIRYTPRTERDLEVSAGRVLTFPARMKGPFTVTLKGKPIPEAIKDSPQVLVGNEKCAKTGRIQLWVVVAGSPERVTVNERRWLPARILHKDGPDVTKVAEKDPSPVRDGKPYAVVVRVRERNLSASVNGRTIGSVKKPAGVFGVVGFEARNWTEVVIDGVIEPSWIQSKIDDVVQRSLELFREDYDPTKYLPEWFLESEAESGAATQAAAALWPAAVAPTHHGSLAAVDDLIERGGALLAILRLQLLATQDVAPSACAYLGAKAWSQMFRLPRALDRIDACLERSPAFLRGQVLRAGILARMGRSEEAREAFAKARLEHPKTPLVYEKAVHHLLLEGRPEQAEKITQTARIQGVSSEELDALDRALAKARGGPSWTRVHEYESANYHVLSDIDVSTCRKAAKTLEEGLREYQSTLKHVRRDRTQRFKVYLFRGRAGFLTYMKDLESLGGGVPHGAAGAYSPLLKQLLIWNLPNREQMLETVRHEGLHQYLDRFLPYVPPWFNEGLAEYYEHGHRVAGKIYFGRPQRDYVDLLKRRPPLPLKTFLNLSPREFYRGGVRHYAQAWAFMHLLRHGQAEWQKLFRRLLEDLEKRPAHEALARAFDPVDLDALDEELVAHLAGLAEAKK